MYVFAALIAVIIALGGVASCEHKKVISLEVEIQANKIEAKRQLVAAEKQGKLDAIQSQADYDSALKTLDDRNKLFAGQLRDPGRRNSCPSSSGPVAGVPEAAATGSDISDSAGAFLRSEADRADVAATYAAKCREFALKPSIREQVSKLRSAP